MEKDELARQGIRAYQGGEFPIAIEFLKTLLEKEPKLWTCRLYLAMSYVRCGDQAHARQELTAINQFCTDQSVKKKALDAMRALNGMAADIKNAG